MVSVGGCLTCFTIAYLILVIVGAALFGASFAVIDFNRAGLQKNKFTISIDSSQIYQSGRYTHSHLLRHQLHKIDTFVALPEHLLHMIQPGRL